MTGREGGQTETTPLQRLGHVFYWLAPCIAALYVVHSVALVVAGDRDILFWAAFFAVIAVASWGIGRALRHVLEGR
ncbi:MAG: hypothetical protein O3A51_13440 [Verrucomicrobia bacterium]|nr:hypothetical protein [Verrucomicrobiota bacterium]